MKNPSANNFYSHWFIPNLEYWVGPHDRSLGAEFPCYYFYLLAYKNFTPIYLFVPRSKEYLLKILYRLFWPFRAKFHVFGFQ